jgi:hypothetical protein
MVSARVATSKPSTDARPLVGVSSPQSTRIVVDLPAPLGPRNPKDLALADLKRNVIDSA